MVFKKGRQYATAWLKRADIGYRHSYRTVGGIQYRPIDCCVEALRRDPEYAEAWCKLGSEITKMNHSEDTDKTLIGMDLFKDEPKITYNIGTNYPLINAAVFCFDKAIEIEPKYVDAWYQKGSWYNSWLYMEKEKIECFLEVTKLDPSISKAWHSLANAYASLIGVDGNFGKALKCYDEAINKAANDKYVVADAADLYDVFTDKANLLSECVDRDEQWYNDTDSDLKKKYSSGKDALMCYDKSLEIMTQYSYASYKKACC
uniref:Isopropylmalate/homocitrate/citramalate synthase family protein n=1 Tax=uncultured marine thaumarchaeote KM3_95_D02 TaxID=1456347 RepID=A0A075HWW3_9ARCH|nr:Isopropylmalate/homocitrate/citramalate synthase family protein [uncultured marine thaumarchaeote KM3_95_D02]